MHAAHDNAELIHLPVHASSLNQAELFYRDVAELPLRVYLDSYPSL